jgi:hypothetical protein
MAYPESLHPCTKKGTTKPVRSCRVVPPKRLPTQKPVDGSEFPQRSAKWILGSLDAITSGQGPLGVDLRESELFFTACGDPDFVIK